MQCFRNFPVAKKFTDKGGGVINILRRKNFLSQCRKIFQGNLLLLHFFQVSKNVRDKRGGKRDISSENFRLAVLKIFVEEPFCSVFQKFSGSEKVYG